MKIYFSIEVEIEIGTVEHLLRILKKLSMLFEEG